MAENFSLLRLKAGLDKVYSTDPPTFGAWLAGTLRMAEEGSVKMEFVVRQEMCNPAGVLHGGVIAGILDEVTGIAMFSLGQQNYHTTINLVVDYFVPSLVSDAVMASALIIKQGKKISHVQGELRNVATGRLLARAGTNVIWIDKEIGH